MSSQTRRDLAFNPSYWAYDVGRPNRVRSLFIRVSREKPEASATLNMKDDSGAGREWSPQELDIENVPKHERAVVMGEFLPKGASDGVTGREPGLAPFADLNAPEGTYEIVPHQENTQIVVRLVEELTFNKNLYILQSKGADGLCRLFPLPSDECVSRLVYYSEWSAA